jgi:hypothetical protein
MTAPRAISAIALDIVKAWHNPYYGAVPYLEALLTLNTIDDMYICEDAHSVILYFLSNAATFRGPQAKVLKAELKALL